MHKIEKPLINRPVINNGRGTERTETEKEVLGLTFSNRFYLSCSMETIMKYKTPDVI